MYDRDNLVVLEYDFRTGDFNLNWLKNVKSGKYISVHGVEKESLRIDGDRWDFEVWRNNMIGQRRNFNDPYAPGMVFGGVIGIYDLTNGEHKKNIRIALKEAEKTYRKLNNGFNKD